jgi:membrane protein
MWKLLKATVLSFIEDEALSRGAAIAFYTVTSLAPILLIVVAVAGLAFGQEAAQHAITTQLTGLMGQQTADILQTVVAGAAHKASGILATAIGIVTLLVTASGVFGEMQTALNRIWDAEPRSSTISRLIWARAVSLGLVVALGFLLLVSLAVSAVLTAFGSYLNSVLPFGGLILSLLNFIVSLALISVLFAAIYKVLPDRPIAWRDVITGGVVTALLFTGGKSLIGWYLGSSAVASSYGVAGGLIVLLLWVYYSTQIFLLGAEFTRAYASFRRGEDPVAARKSDRSAKNFDGGTKEDRASSSVGTGNPPAPTAEGAMSTPDHKEPSLGELERDAERNRVELMDAVDALQKRISPNAIKRDVQDYVRVRKDSFLQTLEQRARDNPVQTVAIGAAVAYPLWRLAARIPVPLLLIGAGLALSRRSTETREERHGQGFASAASGLGRATDTAKQKFSEVADAARDQVRKGIESAQRTGDWISESTTKAAESTGRIAANIGERASGSAETLLALSSDAASKAGDVLSPDRIKRAGTQAGDWIEETVSRNPVIVGAVGLAIGAVIAAALPSTRQEDALLGQAADDVKRRAQSAAFEGLETAKGAAMEVYQEAAKQANEQGLSLHDAKDFAGEIGAKVRTAVANVSGEKRPGDDPAPNPAQNTNGAAG